MCKVVRITYFKIKIEHIDIPNYSNLIFTKKMEHVELLSYYRLALALIILVNRCNYYVCSRQSMRLTTFYAHATKSIEDITLAKNHIGTFFSKL